MAPSILKPLDVSARKETRGAGGMVLGPKRHHDPGQHNHQQACATMPLLPTAWPSDQWLQPGSASPRASDCGPGTAGLDSWARPYPWGGAKPSPRSAAAPSTMQPRSQLTVMATVLGTVYRMNATVLFRCLLLVSTLSSASVQERGTALRFTQPKSCLCTAFSHLQWAFSLAVCLQHTDSYSHIYTLEITCAVLALIYYLPCSCYLSTATPSHSCSSNHKMKKTQVLSPVNPASFSLCVAASFGLGVHKVVSVLFSFCTHAGP